MRDSRHKLLLNMFCLHTVRDSKIETKTANKYTSIHFSFEHIAVLKPAHISFKCKTKDNCSIRLNPCYLIPQIKKCLSIGLK